MNATQESEATAVKTEVVRRALELGFARCGVAPAVPTARADFLHQWLDEGRHGTMAWLAREPERRADPQRVLPGARSVLMLGLNYWQPAPDCRGRVARYALGEDYHDLLAEKLRALLDWLAHTHGGEHKLYVDTGPVLERPLAARAGVGWQGKSTMLISEQLGPWLFLGEILTTLELPPDPPARDRCGSCTACLDACPTGAITAPYQMDARRCISYLTIELKGSIPVELRPLVGDRIYGCDECLEVCPWNRFAQSSREARLTSERRTPARWDLHELLQLSREAFNRRYKFSPIKRVKRRGLLRNVCVALGNIGTAADLPALRVAMAHEEELVREHAAWAVGRIEARLAEEEPAA